MKMTEKQLNDAIKKYFDPVTGVLLKPYNIASIRDPLTGEIFADVEDAQLTDAANVARLQVLRAQIKAELIANLQANLSW